jgi:acyl-lipid omega-6 desaturase (Delta-12 desaturase)
MTQLDTKLLRRTLAPYIAPSDRLAWSMFAATMAVYAGAVAIAGFSAAPLWLRVAASIVAGLAIPSLFVIGHDAAHGAFTARRVTNDLIGRVAMLPALHNFSLWQYVHNHQHHRQPNLRGGNSWSPPSWDEYRRMSWPARARTRLYRSALGFAPYYLIERWWRAKFFPRRDGPVEHRAAQWRDFALLLVYLAAFLVALALAGGALSVLLGFAVPFLIWNAMMGATTYLQHTNIRAPWFDSIEAWRDAARDEDVTIHLRVPRWYGLVSHHIMAHSAHHILPKIPLYRLQAAQARLDGLLGGAGIIEDFSPRYLWRTLRTCRLYDYQARRWLDFAGRPTAESA